jgi:hypothetical protein
MPQHREKSKPSTHKTHKKSRKFSDVDKYAGDIPSEPVHYSGLDAPGDLLPERLEVIPYNEDDSQSISRVLASCYQAQFSQVPCNGGMKMVPESLEPDSGKSRSKSKPRSKSRSSSAIKSCHSRTKSDNKA